MSPYDEHMRHALRLAEQCSASTTPNPRVGCVLVKDGAVVGEGYTQPPGGNHAEVQALVDARAKRLDVRGATAFVSLEPCSHTGRTPPCADALIKAGIAKVVAAVEDPNPLVSGQGMERLAAAGIEVVCGVLAEQAREVNIGFFSRMQRGRPWVRMKLAASLDGRTALHNGQSQWITGPDARADGHVWRARACSILTGIGTVKADDPQLTVRAVPTTRQPQRIVVDSALEIDPAAKVLAGGEPLVFAASGRPEQVDALRAVGAEVIMLPNAHGKVDLPQVMAELGRRSVNELHVEAGPKLNGSLVREGCVDELLVYLAPSLLGDAQGMFELKALERLEGQKRLRFHEVKQLGPDLRILARFL